MAGQKTTLKSFPFNVNYKQMKEALRSKGEDQTPHQIVKGICGYDKGGGSRI